jgi:putative acetyltransferase
MLPAKFDDITIRLASNQDREKVTRHVGAVLSEFGLSLDPSGTDADLLDIEKHYLAPGGLFEIIEDERGDLLGTVGLYRLDEKSCELRKMYFAPEVRGRGLGKYVLERAVEKAKSLGFEQMILETASVLKAANHLYVKYGFRPLAREHLPSRADLAYILDLNEK